MKKNLAFLFTLASFTTFGETNPTREQTLLENKIKNMPIDEVCNHLDALHYKLLQLLELSYRLNKPTHAICDCLKKLKYPISRNKKLLENHKRQQLINLITCINTYKLQTKKENTEE